MHSSSNHHQNNSQSILGTWAARFQYGQNRVYVSTVLNQVDNEIVGHGSQRISSGRKVRKYSFTLRGWELNDGTIKISFEDVKNAIIGTETLTLQADGNSIHVDYSSVDQELDKKWTGSFTMYKV